jgi:hypothetical protein
MSFHFVPFPFMFANARESIEFLLPGVSENEFRQE